jgi:hypothetical protein
MGFYLALGIAKADDMGSLGENLPLVGIEIDRSPVCRGCPAGPRGD